jgi:hypothetical protein
MTEKFYEEKIQKMLEDLLVKIHQELMGNNKVSISDIELLKELNNIYFNLNKQNKKT